MDILNKIDELRKQNNWSIYKLADEAGLTQSTISNMFARKSNPSITTLEQICNAFNISLSEFFAEDNSNISAEENSLLSNYKKLNNRDKSIVKTLINKMNETK